MVIFSGGHFRETTAGFGFTSGYNYKPDGPGLVPAGQGELYDDNGYNGYSITPNGNYVHINFWGMIIPPGQEILWLLTDMMEYRHGRKP